MPIGFPGPQPFQHDVLQKGHVKFQQRVVWFWLGTGTAVLGDAAEIDFTVTTHGIGTAVKQMANLAVSQQRVVGHFLRASATLNWVPVVIEGAFGDFTAAGAASSGINVTAIAAHDALVGGLTGAAGRLQVQSTFSANTRFAALAMEAAVANKARAIILNPLSVT